MKFKIGDKVYINKTVVEEFLGSRRQDIDPLFVKFYDNNLNKLLIIRDVINDQVYFENCKSFFKIKELISAKEHEFKKQLSAILETEQVILTTEERQNE